MIKPKPIIALDCDGVLLDYNLAYASLWKKAFGEYPNELDPHAYSHFDRWDVRHLEGKELQRLRDCMDWHFWSTIPPIEGTLSACNDLISMGYDLVCVTAIDQKHLNYRWDNLQDWDFNMKHVYATGHDTIEGLSPKSRVINLLKPVYFVDDFLPYFRGVDPSVNKILIDRAKNKSPNVGEELQHVQPYKSLREFVDQILSASRV